MQCIEIVIYHSLMFEIFIYVPQTKPFPSQEELVDRLDVNTQWDEFKKETLQEFLRNRARVRSAWTAK